MSNKLKHFDKITKEGRDLFARKANDYGGTLDNISMTGLSGIAVRLVDKIARLHSLTNGVEQKVKDESIRDTLIDISNYGKIGVLLLDGVWDKSHKEDQK